METSTTIPGLIIPSCHHVDSVASIFYNLSYPLLSWSKAAKQIKLGLSPDLVAVDVLLELNDNHVWGIYVHVTPIDPEPVSAKFETMCTEAGWFSDFYPKLQLHLLFLSPTPTIKAQTEQRMKTNYDSTIQLKLWFASRDDVECLRDIPWVDHSQFTDNM